MEIQIFMNIIIISSKELQHEQKFGSNYLKSIRIHFQLNSKFSSALYQN